MKNSRTGATNRAGIAGVVVAALGLLLGMAFVAPAGAQDDGDSYTTAGPSGDVAADSAVDTGGTAGPSDAAADSAATAGAPGGTGTPSTSGGTPGTSGGTPGASSSGVGTPGASSGPLARTGFGASLPSLLATALVAGGAMLVITFAKRRRNN